MGTHKLFFAGSGGQGILLMGQMITKAAMIENKEATFMPSYGPEIRGGTANCTVVVSDKPVRCPVIYEADAVVVMNFPSLLKFEPLVKPGGSLFLNTTIIGERPTRTDITVYDVPANELAMQLGNIRTANMIMLGALVRKTGVVSQEAVETVLQQVFGAKKAELVELNKKAYNYWNK